MEAQNKKKVLIVGSGIAGLCTGVYAAKSGFAVEIVEMSHSSGGLAMSWKRNGYTFETCLHWLLGSHPASPYYSLWREVFDIEKLKFFDSSDYSQIETEGGQRLSIKRNLDAMERELLRFAPEDRKATLRFMKGLRRLEKCELPLSQDGVLANLIAWVKMLPYLPDLKHWSRISCRELASEFQNPVLKRFFGGPESSQLVAVGLLFAIVWMCNKNAGYPLGGSQAVIQLIEQKFESLGGKIRFNSKVDRFLAKDGKATGVHLVDGTELQADWVVSAADGHSTLFEWLPKEYRDKKAEEPYRTLSSFPSYLQVSLGIRRRMDEEPGHFVRVLSKPWTLDPSTTVEQMAFRVFNFDPTFAPPGKTAVICFLPTFDYLYWTRLHDEDPSAYKARKEEVAREVIDVLDRRNPGIRSDVEVIDVSTPVSVIRYTGNWKGSMEGFFITPGMSYKPLPMSLPKLKNFMMVGQWVAPGGGLPSGLMTARQAVQAICKAEKQPFKP